MQQDTISYLAVKKTNDEPAMEEEDTAVCTAWWLVNRGRLEMILSETWEHWASFLYWLDYNQKC